MKTKLMFPTTVIDDFYKDPDKVREYALSLEFHKDDGKWPGKRTEELSILNREFFDQTANMFFSVYYDFLNPVEWTLSTRFQYIDPLNEDKFNLANAGWIHTDSGMLFAGIIYLNPNPDPDSGTCIYEPIGPVDNKFFEDVEEESKIRIPQYLNDKTEPNHEEVFTKHRNKFQESLEVKNKYNRLIVFDSQLWHGVKTIKCNNEPRLTQVFFVSKIKSASKPAYNRIEKFSLV